MADPISPAISDRICKHMNEDHAEAVTIYAKVFGGAAQAIAAEMVSIDPHGMDLNVQEDGSTKALRIEFDHELQDSEDAHHTLIAMIKQARSQAAP